MVLGLTGSQSASELSMCVVTCLGTKQGQGRQQMMAMRQGWGDVKEGAVERSSPLWYSPVPGSFQWGQFQEQPRGLAELWCQPWFLALARCDPAAQAVLGLVFPLPTDITQCSVSPGDGHSTRTPPAGLQMRGFKEAEGRGLRAFPRHLPPRMSQSGGPRCRWPQEGAGLLPSAPAHRTVASGG